MEKKLKLHRKFDVKEKKTDDAEPMKCPKQMVTMTTKEGSTCGTNQLEHLQYRLLKWRWKYETILQWISHGLIKWLQVQKIAGWDDER